MINPFDGVARFYYSGRKIAYYKDLIFEVEFEEDKQKRNQTEERADRLQKRVDLLKPRGLLKKVPYIFGRIVGW